MCGNTGVSLGCGAGTFVFTVTPLQIVAGVGCGTTEAVERWGAVNKIKASALLQLHQPPPFQSRPYRCFSVHPSPRTSNRPQLHASRQDHPKVRQRVTSPSPPRPLTRLSAICDVLSLTRLARPSARSSSMTQWRRQLPRSQQHPQNLARNASKLERICKPLPRCTLQRFTSARPSFRRPRTPAKEMQLKSCSCNTRQQQQPTGTTFSYQTPVSFSSTARCRHQLCRDLPAPPACHPYHRPSSS